MVPFQIVWKIPAAIIVAPRRLPIRAIRASMVLVLIASLPALERGVIGIPEVVFLGGGVRTCTALFLLRGQHLHPARNHLDGGARYAVIVGILAQLEAPFDEYLAPLVQIGVADFGKLAPGH